MPRFQPTLNPDASGLKRDWVLVSRISRYFDNYRRGDVVTFWCVTYVGRVFTVLKMSDAVAGIRSTAI